MNKPVTSPPPKRSSIVAARVARDFARSGGPGVQVLDDVNLTLRKGEIVGLLGQLRLRQIDASCASSRAS